MITTWKTATGFSLPNIYSSAVTAAGLDVGIVHMALCVKKQMANSLFPKVPSVIVMKGIYPLRMAQRRDFRKSRLLIHISARSLDPAAQPSWLDRSQRTAPHCRKQAQLR